MEATLQRAAKVMAQISELAAISEEKNGITRLFGTPAFLLGSNYILGLMKAAGLDAHIDNMGNVRGRLASANTNAKTMVIASHIDTVRNAGRFDGPMGVLLGLDLIAQIITTRSELPFHIELVAFSDEEGVRFHTTYLGSKVVAGSFENGLLHKTDDAGISLQDAIVKMGGNPMALPQDAIKAGNWLGYFEIHIEQGPVLFEADIPVAVVTAIAGQKRAEITFEGVAGHAGTVPMQMRQDALCCAAEFILETEKLAINNKIVATVGKLQISDAASNTIPGTVTCTLDLRSADEAVSAAAYEQLQQNCITICHKRKITPVWKLVQQTAPVQCDEGLNALLSEAIQQCGYPLITMPSGAGHDAVAVAAVSPVAMLFVRCYKGISHHPKEDVALKDMADAIKVSDNFIQQLIRRG